MSELSLNFSKIEKQKRRGGDRAPLRASPDMGLLHQASLSPRAAPPYHDTPRTGGNGDLCYGESGAEGRGTWEGDMGDTGGKNEPEKYKAHWWSLLGYLEASSAR